MRAKAELQVLDEPVRSVSATGLTAQIGLTGQTAQTVENTDLATKNSTVKAEDQDWRLPLISYLNMF